MSTSTSRILRRSDSDARHLSFWCPGCDHAHSVRTGPNGWDWNGDVHKPTFTPSIKVTWPSRKGERCCHSFVADGVIDFLGDCTHALRGKHPIPDWPKPDWGGTVPASA